MAFLPRERAGLFGFWTLALSAGLLWHLTPGPTLAKDEAEETDRPVVKKRSDDAGNEEAKTDKKAAGGR